MVKRKKLPRKAQAAATAAEAKAAAAPNMFERLHSRKKFSVLGKRAKGEQRGGQAPLGGRRAGGQSHRAFGRALGLLR